MSTEYNIPLSRKVINHNSFMFIIFKTNFQVKNKLQRNSHESHEIKRLWNELGTNVPDLKKINPIYKISEFLGNIKQRSNKI